MKENLKTFILTSLVVISLIFTERLWLEFPVEVFSNFTKNEEAYGASYLLSDMIVPNKYLLTFKDNNHTFYYDDSRGLWNSSRESLNKILSSKDVKSTIIEESVFSSYGNKRSIVFYFPEKINTYILAKSLDVKNPNNIVEEIPETDYIYIYLGFDESFFVFAQDDKYLRIEGNLTDVLSLQEKVTKIEQSGNYDNYRSMNTALDVDNNIYITYNIAGNLPEVYVENEIRNLNELERQELAENFFEKDIDYIREIVESNGSTIYMYNQRVLKLNINGVLEYFHPLDKKVEKRNLYQSLSTAAEFISENAGVQKGMYLAKVEEISEDNGVGYKLIFRYRVRGIPVILGNDMVDFIQIETYNNHIKSYKHFIRKDMNKSVDNSIISGEKMLPSFDIIDINYEFLYQKYLEENNIVLEEFQEPDINDFLSSNFIQDITLSYFDPCLKDKEDQLIGVWVIKTTKSSYAFDIYTGDLVYIQN